MKKKNNRKTYNYRVIGTTYDRLGLCQGIYNIRVLYIHIQNLGYTMSDKSLVKIH